MAANSGIQVIKTSVTMLQTGVSIRMGRLLIGCNETRRLPGNIVLVGVQQAVCQDPIFLLLNGSNLNIEFFTFISYDYLTKSFQIVGEWPLEFEEGAATICIVFIAP